MADSKRLLALKRLCDHLQSEITVENGYKHTLPRDGVVRGRLEIDDGDPLPMISILENIEPDRYPNRAGGDEHEAPTQNERWILLFAGWTDDDKQNPCDPAYELMADVKKALAKIAKDAHPLAGIPAHPNYMLGGLISKLEMEPGTVRPPAEQPSGKAYFWLRVVLGFVEDLNDPYMLPDNYTP